MLVLILGGWLLFARMSGRTMQFVRAARGPAVKAVYATGTVEASIMIPISPDSGARISELFFDENDSVAEGAVLGKLEDDDLSSSLDELRARADFLEKEFKRTKDLEAKRVLSLQELQRAESQWLAAKAAVKREQSLIAQMKLVSPGDCRVIRRDGEIGEFVPANQPVFWLDCGSHLRISADVDEEDIPGIEKGQQVLIRADAFPDQVFYGTVSSVTPKGDPVARSFRVRINFDEKSPLKIGMTTETNIVKEQKENALLLPATAVWSGGVFRLVDNTLQFQKIMTGITGREKIEVLEGLTEDDLVLLKPESGTESGTRVRPEIIEWSNDT